MNRRMGKLGKRVQALVLVTAMGVVASGCAGEKDPLEIGLRRVALDLAFKDAEKAVPVEPRIIRREIVEYTGYDEEYFEELEPAPRPRPRPFIPPREKWECAEADPNATPEVPAFHVQKGKPIEGTYPRHNKGTIKITLPALGTATLPVPPRSTWDTIGVLDVNRSRALRPEDQSQLPDQVESNTTVAPAMVRFTQVKKLTRTSSVSNTYEYDGEFLHLVERKTVASGNETLFRPTPPIRYIALNETEGPDSEVTHAGIDRERNLSMTVETKIVGREWVDVCGEVIDTYRVQVVERMVDLSPTLSEDCRDGAQQPPGLGTVGTVGDCSPRLSGNVNEGQFNYWNIQFDNNLNLVREQVDSIVQAGAATVEYKYESVLDKLTPDPLKTNDEPATTATTTPDDEEEDA